jgi:hypothetical protein
MTLPTSGPLALSQIQTEFGGSNPISLSEYYAGGANVPAGTTGTNGAVPSSGTISIWNFYGTSDVVILLNDQYIGFSSGGLTSSTVSYQLTSGGQAEGSQQGFYYNLEQWCTPTSQASNYEARVSNVTGTTPSGPINTWVALSSTREWSLFAAVNNAELCDFLVEIRRIGTTTILADATITLYADAQL